MPWNAAAPSGPCRDKWTAASRPATLLNSSWNRVSPYRQLPIMRLSLAKSPINNPTRSRAMKLIPRPKHFAIAALALACAAGAGAKTLVFCSEGSPENFYPGVNTTGTSFDGNEPIYNRIVDFERGGTKVIPGLAEKWTISEDGKVYTFNLRRGVKWHSTSRSFK